MFLFITTHFSRKYFLITFVLRFRHKLWFSTNGWKLENMFVIVSLFLISNKNVYYVFFILWAERPILQIGFFFCFTKKIPIKKTSFFCHVELIFHQQVASVVAINSLQFVVAAVVAAVAFLTTATTLHNRGRFCCCCCCSMAYSRLTEPVPES